MGNGPDAIATLLDTGTRGVAPATVTVAPAGTVTLIPPGPTTGCQEKHKKSHDMGATCGRMLIAY